MAAKHKSIETKYLEDRENLLRKLGQLPRRSFLKVAAATAGAAMAKGLLPPHSFQMVEVAGAPFVAAVEQALDALGRSLGITTAVSAAADEAMRGLLREFMLSVHDYALQVLATGPRRVSQAPRRVEEASRPISALSSLATAKISVR